MLGFLFRKKSKNEEIQSIKEKVEEDKKEKIELEEKEIPEIHSLELSTPQPENVAPSPEEKKEEVPSQEKEKEQVEIKEQTEKKDISSLFDPKNLLSESAKDTALETPEESKKEETPKVLETEEKEKKEEVISGENNVLLKNLVKEHQVITPPLFISVKKYKEIVNELMSLKISITALESILKLSRTIGEQEKEQVKNFLDELEKINAKMKYFTEIFKLKR